MFNILDQILITHEKNKVTISLGKPMEYLSFNPTQANQLADMIKLQALKAELE